MGSDTDEPRRLRVFLTHTAAELLISFPPSELARLEQDASVTLNVTDQVLAGEALARAAAGCDIIIANRSTPGEAATFAASPDLLAFLRAAVDTSTIDVGAASSHGVLVTRVVPGFADAVAELGVGMMIDIARGLSKARRMAEPGAIPAAILGTQLLGKTAGIVGYGRIGQRLGVLCRGLGMRVAIHDPQARPDAPDIAVLGLADLLNRSDFVICLAAAVPATRNLFNASAFASMRRGAFFLNLSRGGLVDDDALEASLDAGHLGGAGLDVGTAADEMPQSRFFSRTDVVATPHIGGATLEARRFQAGCTVDQVRCIAAGRIPEGALNAGSAGRLARLSGRSGPALPA